MNNEKAPSIEFPKLFLKKNLSKLESRVRSYPKWKKSLIGIATLGCEALSTGLAAYGYYSLAKGNSDWWAYVALSGIPFLGKIVGYGSLGYVYRKEISNFLKTPITLKKNNIYEQNPKIKSFNK